MSATTIFLGKLLGLYLSAISVALLLGRPRMLTALDEMVHSGPWMLFSGMIATAAGLALVLAHNEWTGGALTVAVSLAGWAALVKGLSLMIIPPEIMARAYRAIGYKRFFRLWTGAVLVLGLCIAASAFTS